MKFLFNFGCSTFVDAHFTQIASNTSACAGQDILLSWTYDTEDSVRAVYWKKDEVIVMVKYASSPMLYIFNTTKYEHVTNGEMKIHNLTVNDTGFYRITISYVLDSGIPTISSGAYLTVLGKDFLLNEYG